MLSRGGPSPSRGNVRTTDPAQRPPPLAAKQVPDARRPRKASMVVHTEASLAEPELRTLQPRSPSARRDSGGSTPHEPSLQKPEESPKRPRGTRASALPARRLSIASSAASSGSGASRSPLRGDDEAERRGGSLPTSTAPSHHEPQRRRLSVSRPDYDADEGSGGSVAQILPQPNESSISAGSAPPSLPRGVGSTNSSGHPDVSNGSLAGAVSPNRWPKAWQQQILSDMVKPIASAGSAHAHESGPAQPRTSHPSNGTHKGGRHSHADPAAQPSFTPSGDARAAAGATGPGVFPAGTIPLSSLALDAMGSARNGPGGGLAGADVPQSPASVSSSFGTDTPTPRSILRQPGSHSRQNDSRRITFAPPVSSPHRQRSQDTDDTDDSSVSDSDDGVPQRTNGGRGRHRHRHRRGSDDDDEDDFSEPSLSYSEGTDGAYRERSPILTTNLPARVAPSPKERLRHATVPPDEEDERTIQESDRNRMGVMAVGRTPERRVYGLDEESLSPSHSRSPSKDRPSPNREGAGPHEDGEGDAITEPHSRQRSAAHQWQRQYAPRAQAPLPAALDPRNRRQPRWPTERRGSDESSENSDDDRGGNEDDPPTEAAETHRPRSRSSRERVLPYEEDSALNESHSNDSGYETPRKPQYGQGPSPNSSAEGPAAHSPSRPSSSEGTASPESEGRQRRHHHHHHHGHRHYRSDSSRSSLASSFNSSGSSPSRSTAPPQHVRTTPNDIGLPPLPVSPYQPEAVARVDAGGRGHGEDGSRTEDSEVSTLDSASVALLSDPTPTPTKASAPTATAHPHSPSAQTTGLAGSSVSTVSSVDERAESQHGSATAVTLPTKRALSPGTDRVSNGSGHADGSDPARSLYPQQPQRRRGKRRTSSTAASKGSDSSVGSEGSAHSRRQRHHHRHHRSTSDNSLLASQQSEDGSGRHRRHRSSSSRDSQRHAPSRAAARDGNAATRKRSGAASVEPAQVAIQPLPQSRRSRPRLEPPDTPYSTKHSVELLPMAYTTGDGPRVSEGNKKLAQRLPKVQRPRSPAADEGSESVLVDGSSGPYGEGDPAEDVSFGDRYYNVGVSPTARDQTAGPRGDSDSVSGGVSADAFLREGAKGSSPLRRPTSSPSDRQPSHRSGHHARRRRHRGGGSEDDANSNGNDSHSSGEGSKRGGSPPVSAVSNASEGRTMRKKLVVVQRRKRKGAPPSDDDPVVRLSLLPFCRAPEVLSKENAAKPLGKLYDRVMSSPSSLSQQLSARSHSSQRQSKGGGDSQEPPSLKTQDEGAALDRLTFRRALSAASSRSASRRSSTSPSAAPSALNYKSTGEHADATQGSGHHRRHHRSRSRRRGDRHTGGGSPSREGGGAAAGPHSRRRRTVERPTPTQSAPRIHEGSGYANSQLMKNLSEMRQHNGSRDRSATAAADDGTGASLFSRGPSGITPISVNVFPRLLSLSETPVNALSHHHPMSEDEEPDVSAAARMRAAQVEDSPERRERSYSRSESNAGVPTFVAVPVIRRQEPRGQLVTGEVPLIDRLLDSTVNNGRAAREPLLQLRWTDGPEQEPLDSFLKPSQQSSPASQQQRMPGEPAWRPYEGVQPLQPSPAFAPPIITEDVNRLSREWQDALRPSQSKRRRKDEEAMLFGSSRADVDVDVGASGGGGGAEGREKAYAAAAEFRGKGTGLPPSSPSAAGRVHNKGDVSESHTGLQRRTRALLPFRRSDPSEYEVVKDGKMGAPAAARSLVAQAGSQKKTPPPQRQVPSCSSSIHSVSSFSPDNTGSSIPKRNVDTKPQQTSSNEAENSDDGEMAGVLTEPSPQWMDSSGGSRTARAQKDVEEERDGVEDVAPLPPAPPSPSSYGVFDPLTKQSGRSPSSSSSEPAVSSLPKAKSKAEKKEKEVGQQRRKRRSPRHDKSRDKRREKDHHHHHRHHDDDDDDDGRPHEDHTERQLQKAPRSGEARKHQETSIAYQLERIRQKRREAEAKEKEKEARRKAKAEKHERQGKGSHAESPRKQSKSRGRSGSHSRDKREKKSKKSKKKEEKAKRETEKGGSRKSSPSRHPSAPDGFLDAADTTADWLGSGASRHRSPPPRGHTGAAFPSSSAYGARTDTPPLRPSSYVTHAGTGKGAAATVDGPTPRSNQYYSSPFDADRERRRASLQKALDDIAERRRRYGSTEEDRWGRRYDGSYTNDDDTSDVRGDHRYSRYRRPSGGGGRRLSSATPADSFRRYHSAYGSGGSVDGGSRYASRSSAGAAAYARGDSYDGGWDRKRSYFADFPRTHDGYSAPSRKSYFSDGDPVDGTHSYSSYSRYRGSEGGGRDHQRAPPPPPQPSPPNPSTSSPWHESSGHMVSTPPQTGEEHTKSVSSTRTAAASAAVRAAPPPPPPPPGATPVSRGESPEEIVKEYEVTDPKVVRRFAHELSSIVNGLKVYQELS